MRTDADGTLRFHQIQCLASLRSALQSAQDGKDIGNSEKEGRHWSHCFDYLYQVWRLCCNFEGTFREADEIPIVQTLRCYGDDTDEWEIFTRPRSKQSSGMDTMRTCRDTSQLVKRACDARKFYIDVGWIDGSLPSMCETGEMPW